MDIKQLFHYAFRNHKLIFSIQKHGYNLLSLLHFVSKSEAFIEDDTQKIYFKQWYHEVLDVSQVIENKYNIR